MDLWKSIVTDGFEQLLFIQDRPSGLKAVIAIHDTTLGPAMGGCRFWHYGSEEEAVSDALRLAKGMTYKCAISGLPYGGGKAVVIRQPGQSGNEAAFRALGRIINRLGGLYITGMDLGTTVREMDWIKAETDYVTDTAGSLGAAGDFTARMTAYGVCLGIQASLEEAFGSDELRGRTIAVQGLGKVGYFVCRYLHRKGACLLVTDLHTGLVEKAVKQFNAIAVETDDIYRQDCDAFCPCALGGIINERTIPQLRCRIVAGAANNQLAEQHHGDMLHRNGILYAPDYVINAGGIIVTAAEIAHRSGEYARRRVMNIRNTLNSIYRCADSLGISSSEAANRLTRQRLG
ncbi:leucine dehydrogenase [Paenibacillus darwinianus]|uniref:Leucine dehydrogenase n=1 Tax=Paenibacillus darwinianus TaxID=1380763 RepID=A0A9W5S3T9_9BACL|nr:Glu/Leu/Phe/Val dehydrogenase dimerization domain-containing protein [Paenibacillus darwinianus]EXX91652.1 leucine dehydrogenase [Paenibacillus darwinianus]EXX91795.1 leucine dehydrogenase [Paenibacillus darwinianus]EXX92407.1 leucine dehydrogenase [Paenibacillus darwinianus]